MKIILLFIIFFNFVSCGYKPSSKFARSIVGEKISTSIIISQQDPENTVIIKDAVDAAIIEVFQASLTSKVLSDTHLVMNIANTYKVPIVYDKDGFVIGYRMYLKLNIKRYHNGSVKKYTTIGTYDFSIAPNAVITDKERFDAISFSATKAIQAFIAQLSAEGARANKV